VVEEVDDGSGLGRGRAEELLAVFIGDERDELCAVRTCIWWIQGFAAYLVEVHNGLPLVVALHVEVAHTDLSEVTRMVLIQVGTVVVLTTGKTALEMDVSIQGVSSQASGNLHHRDACGAFRHVRVRH
jgi:hypothetical protein